MKRVSEDFMPKTFGGINMWMNNLKFQVALVGALLGLTPAQITDIQDVIQQCMDTINDTEVKKSDLDQALRARDMLFSNQIQVIRTFIKRIKKSEHYTAAIGAQMGVLPGSLVIDTTMVKPSLKLAIEAGSVRIAFKKKYMHGVSIFSRPRGILNWQKIAQVSFSPFIDVRSLAEAGKPEAREYMALYHDGNKEIGQESDIYSILTGTHSAV